MTNAYPYRLRMEHEGHASLRLERDGRWFRFDPDGDVGPSDVLLLSWNWPENLLAAAAAVQAGERPTVVAPQPVLDWLSGQGAVDAHATPCTIDGVRIESRTYQPIPPASPSEARRKALSALRRPDRALGRLRRKRGLPDSAPVAWRLGFADGTHLVHLNLSLHDDTPDAWLDALVQDWRGAEWLLLGVDFEAAAAVLARVARLEAKRTLFCDLIGQTRRELGMPTALLTPVVDQAQAAGMDAYVFASKVAYRFE